MLVCLGFVAKRSKISGVTIEAQTSQRNACRLACYSVSKQSKIKIAKLVARNYFVGFSPNAANALPTDIKKSIAK